MWTVVGNLKRWVSYESESIARAGEANGDIYKSIEEVEIGNKNRILKISELTKYKNLETGRENKRY